LSSNRRSRLLSRRDSGPLGEKIRRLQPFRKNECSRNSHYQYENVEVAAKDGHEKRLSLPMWTQPPDDPLLPDHGERDAREQREKDGQQLDGPVKHELMGPDCTLADHKENATCEKTGRHHCGQTCGRSSCQPRKRSLSHKPSTREPTQEPHQRHSDQPNWPASDHCRYEEAHEARKQITEEHQRHGSDARQASLKEREQRRFHNHGQR